MSGKTPQTPKPPKKAVDWASLEPHYRAGIRSLAEIGAEFGVTPAAILKHARKNEWSRDLTAKIQAKAEAKVNAAAVNAKVNEANAVNRAVTEKATVEANAELIYQRRLSHRQDIRRSMNAFAVLLGELEVTSNPEGQELIESLVDSMRPDSADDSDETKRKRQALREKLLDRVLGLPERVDTLKKLVEVQDRLVQLERQAFGITDKTPLDPNDAAGGGKVLSDAARASRLAALLNLAAQRKAAAPAEADANAA